MNKSIEEMSGANFELERESKIPQEGSDSHSVNFRLGELKIAVQALSQFRQNDLTFFQNRYDALIQKFDAVEQALPSKVDLIAQLSDLRQRLNDIQAMEASLRDASLQTIRSSFQSEANIIEQKISLGSQQRYSALEIKIDKAELSVQGKVSESRISLEAQLKVLEASVQAKIDRVENGMESKIKGQVMQGIIWGMGLVGGIIAAAFGLLRYASG